MTPSTNGPIDPALVRKMLGLPVGAPDETVVAELNRVGAARMAGSFAQPPPQTVEDAFRAAVGIIPGTSSDDINSKILGVLVQEATNDQDSTDPEPAPGSDEDVRRKLGIDPATWARHNGEAAVKASAAPRAYSAGAVGMSQTAAARVFSLVDDYQRRKSLMG